MKKETFEGNYNGVEFNYNRTGKDGILKIKLKNGVESTHVLNNWAITRVMQYIESMIYLI